MCVCVCVCVCVCIYIYIIYIYNIYIVVLFGPVKPELGVIPSGQENHSGAEHLNFPEEVLLYFFFVFFGSHQKRKNRMEIDL